MKISTSLYFDRSTEQLGTVQSKMAKTQEQLSTGLNVVKPSDEPDKAALITRLESQLARQVGFQNTLKAANVRLTAEEAALNGSSEVLYRVKELSVQAGNDTLNAQDRHSIALELKTLKAQLLSLANSQDSNGNYLFSGGKAAVPAFQADTIGNIQYQGDQSRMQVNIGDNRRLSLNMPGSDAYVRVLRDNGKGAKQGVDFFQSIDDLINGVEAGNKLDVQRGITEADVMQNGISTALGQVGADLSVIDMQNSVLDQLVLRIKSTKSDVQDLDYTEAITRMNKDQLALEAAQSSFAKISKLSLFNYIN